MQLKKFYNENMFPQDFIKKDDINPYFTEIIDNI